MENDLRHSAKGSLDAYDVTHSLTAAGGGAKRKYQYCTDDFGIIINFRALQEHSGRNLIDLSLQDNVVIPSGFFQHIYHIGCAFNLIFIFNSGLILGGQKFEQETDSILLAC